MSSEDSIAEALQLVEQRLETIGSVRADAPIKDREEVIEHLTIRINGLATLGKNSKRKFQARLYEIAAYAMYAALSDQGVKL